MINIRIQTPEVQKLSPKITVVGVGGAGGNAVNNMISSALEGCEFLVCNTDAQALEGSLCENTMQLGAHVTGGLGAGAKPEIGEKAAHESLDEVMQYLEGSNMAFITAGMGGGTGTGAAPVIAKACRDAGILTVGVVTKPFHFEGTHRMRQAESGIEQMQDYVDTLIIIPNQNLFRVANEKTTFAEAFKMADSVLQSGVRGVTDLMVMPGLINLDFADIRSAMLEMGKAMMGTGEGEGERRAIEAAEAAINNPLLDDVSMKGARGVIINVTGGPDMTLFEVDEACNRIREEVDPNANIIFGSTFDEKLEGQMRVSVVATGIDGAEAVNRVRGSSTGTGTGVRVTTINKSEEKAESGSRMIPQTEVARAMTLQGRQTNYQPKPVPARTEPQPAPVQQAPAQMDEPEQDMFEQQEFSAPAQAQQQNMSAYQKAQIFQGSFIPPSPVVPEPQETQRSSGYSPQPQAQQPQQTQQVQYSGLSAKRLDTQEPITVQPTSSLVLRPPVPGASSAERKKSPSLFERITNVYKGEHHEEEGRARPLTGQNMGGNFHSQPNPSQGKLNIDSPAGEPAKSQDDLDIPAFLRRQAN
jgi:cell division protein FtsZ